MPEPLIQSAQPTQGVTWTLSCDLLAVRPICQQTRQFFAGFGLEAEELDAWELVLAEALNNAVRHAPLTRRDKPLALALSVAAELVEVRITDHTEGFDWPDNIELPPPDAESGRGLYLIRHCCDFVAYHRGGDHNLLVLRRKRRRAQALPDAREFTESQRTLDLMTEELASAYESLGAVFRFSADLQTGGAHDAFVRKWLAELLGIAGADWYVLRLADVSQRELRVASHSAAEFNAASLPLRGATLPVAQVEIRAALERNDVWFDDDTPLAADDPLAVLTPLAIGFAHPIVVNDTLIGVLSIGRARTKPAFKAGDINVVQTFADFIGIQIRNEQFRDAQMQAQLLEREYELAGRVQRSLLPTTHPVVRAWKTLGHCKSARRVGGDFYDIVPLGNDCLLLAVADVMGKGTPAALFSAIFRTLLHIRTDHAEHPGELLGWLNRNLLADLGRFDMFIAAMVAHFDARTRELRVAGAGHPPCLVAASDGTITELPGDAPPLGIMNDISTAERSITLPVGARLLLYTDGMSDARNPAGEFLGIDALKRWLGESTRRDVAPEMAREDLLKLVRDFESGAPQTDDQAFILLARDTPPDRR